MKNIEKNTEKRIGCLFCHFGFLFFRPRDVLACACVSQILR